MAKGKYIYRCSLHSCGREVGASVEPATFPTCNGNEGSHSKLMDFIEDRSRGIPRHITESGIKKSIPGDKDSGYKTRDGGNWV